jgi:hypothetical protein
MILLIKTEDNKISSINIYDLTGRCIYSKNNSINKDLVIDLEALNVGVYIADCVSDSNRCSFKFFVK